MPAPRLAFVTLPPWAWAPTRTIWCHCSGSVVVNRSENGGAMDPLEEAHQQLLAMSQALESEHTNLQRNPPNVEAHAAHRDKLRQHIKDLRSHVERIKEERGGWGARVPAGEFHQVFWMTPR